MKNSPNLRTWILKFGKFTNSNSDYWWFFFLPKMKPWNFKEILPLVQKDNELFSKRTSPNGPQAAARPRPWSRWIRKKFTKRFIMQPCFRIQCLQIFKLYKLAVTWRLAISFDCWLDDSEWFGFSEHSAGRARWIYLILLTTFRFRSSKRLSLWPSTKRCRFDIEHIRFIYDFIYELWC